VNEGVKDGAWFEIILDGNGQVADENGPGQGGRTCCMSRVGQQAPLGVPFLEGRSNVLDGLARDFTGDSVRSMSASAAVAFFGFSCGKSSSRSITSEVTDLDFSGRKKG